MTKEQGKISDRVIERILRYKQALIHFDSQGKSNIFSHQLATATGGTPAQVRRDLMAINLKGTPQTGYFTSELLTEINKFVEPQDKHPAALIGIGHLGSAILNYFIRRRPKIPIVAAFDADQDRVDRVIAGCRAYHINDLEKIIEEKGIKLGIITVPSDQAQKLADRLQSAGIKGIINFAPTQIIVKKDVHLESVDITLAIEKTAFFTKGE